MQEIEEFDPQRWEDPLEADMQKEEIDVKRHREKRPSTTQEEQSWNRPFSLSHQIENNPPDNLDFLGFLGFRTQRQVSRWFLSHLI